MANVSCRGQGRGAWCVVGRAGCNAERAPPPQRAADAVSLQTKLRGQRATYTLRRLLHVVAGDGLELVERAAGVLQPAPRDHWNLRRGERVGEGQAKPPPAAADSGAAQSAWRTLQPAAASAGASTSETLSPTPPVECLSTT